MGETLRFAAFISYSHEDELFARAFHARLERYRVPKSLIGTQGARGPVFERLGKVFRDRDEFAAGGELTQEIQAALRSSAALVVLCSPASAASPYVNAEIDYFRRLGRPIVPVLVKGEPGESFPDALKALGEPIAADAREGRDEEHGAMLRVVAGLLGVSLDALVSREAARQRAERRRGLMLVTLGAALVLLGVSASIAALLQTRQNQIARSNLVASYAIQAFEQGNPRLGAFLTLAAMPPNEGSWLPTTLQVRRAMRLAWAQTPRLETLANYDLEGEADAAFISADGEVIFSAGGRAYAMSPGAAPRRQMVSDRLIDTVHDLLLGPEGVIYGVTSTSAFRWRRQTSGVERIFPAANVFEAGTTFAPMRTIALTQNDQVLLVGGCPVGSSGGYLMTLDGANPQPILPGGDCADQMRFSDDGSYLVGIRQHQTLFVVARPSREPGLNLSYGAHIRALAVGNRVVVAGAENGEISTLDLETDRREALNVHPGRVWAVAVSSDGQRIATASDRELVLLARNPLRVQQRISLSGRAIALRFLQDGRIAVAQADGSAFALNSGLIDVAGDDVAGSAAPTVEFPYAEALMADCSSHWPDGCRINQVLYNAAERQWAVSTTDGDMFVVGDGGEVLRDLSPEDCMEAPRDMWDGLHSNCAIGGMALSADGRMLYGATDMGEVFAVSWDGARRYRFEGMDERVIDLRLIAGDEVLAASSYDNARGWWDAATGQIIAVQRSDVPSDGWLSINVGNMCADVRFSNFAAPEEAARVARELGALQSGCDRFGAFSWRRYFGSGR